MPEYIEDARDAKRFDELRKILSDVDTRLMTILDADQLARYVQAEREYVDYTKKLRKAMKSGTIEECGRIQRQQNTAFLQVQKCADALGMNIASRLKFDLPKPPAKEDDDFDRFE